MRTFVRGLSLGFMDGVGGSWDGSGQGQELLLFFPSVPHSSLHFVLHPDRLEVVGLNPDEQRNFIRRSPK